MSTTTVLRLMQLMQRAALRALAITTGARKTENAGVQPGVLRKGCKKYGFIVS